MILGTPRWVMRLSSVDKSRKMDPDIKFVANIHENETVRREMLLHFMEITNISRRNTVSFDQVQRRPPTREKEGENFIRRLFENPELDVSTLTKKKYPNLSQRRFKYFR
ncbi:hypothetical protein WA026_015898 [Henosepilachna vigintioctopunctata]|uniref:Uncharacterized protein n=1 Tax=Henosepilachna vigintioctopunctata TaxID=420089 RepID=A0AAW1U772_9CUCU